MLGKQLAAMLAATAFAVPAYAQEGAEGENFHAENYAGISVTRLTAAPSTNGAAVMFGRRYSEHLAAEVGYEDSSALSSGSEKTTALSVAVVGIQPFTADLEGYVRLGYASAHTQDAAGATANHGDLTYGVGVEYRLDEKYSLGFGYDSVRIGDNVNIPRASENSYGLTLIRSF